MERSPRRNSGSAACMSMAAARPHTLDEGGGVDAEFVDEKGLSERGRDLLPGLGLAPRAASRLAAVRFEGLRIEHSPGTIRPC